MTHRHSAWRNDDVIRRTERKRERDSRIAQIDLQETVGNVLEEEQWRAAGGEGGE